MLNAVPFIFPSNYIPGQIWVQEHKVQKYNIYLQVGYFIVCKFLELYNKFK